MGVQRRQPGRGWKDAQVPAESSAQETGEADSAVECEEGNSPVRRGWGPMPGCGSPAPVTMQPQWWLL